MPAFVTGQQLSRRRYDEVVKPLMQQRFPDVPYAAALVGRGSEVLGFDDETSTDHDWVPRVSLFLRDDDHRRLGAAIGEAVDVEVLTPRGFFLEHLDVDIDADLEPRDWLTLPEHRLRMVTAGAVHHDEIGLQAARDRLAWYPHDVWLYLLVAAWWRIHPEVNLMGRAAAAGDELGSVLIAGELVHALMRLCFLMEREYPPYSKWFGTAFSRLPCAAALSPILSRAVGAPTWREREDALLAAYAEVAAMHDALHLTEPVPTEVVQLWDRPFTVLWGDFPEALAAQITDPAVLRIVEQWPIGGVDQCRDLLWDPRRRRLLLRLFE